MLVDIAEGCGIGRSTVIDRKGRFGEGEQVSGAPYLGRNESDSSCIHSLTTLHLLWID